MRQIFNCFFEFFNLSKAENFLLLEDLSPTFIHAKFTRDIPTHSHGSYVNLTISTQIDVETL